MDWPATSAIRVGLVRIDRLSRKAEESLDGIVVELGVGKSTEKEEEGVKEGERESIHVEVSEKRECV